MIYTGNRNLIKKARELRRNMTLPEILLWSKLRSKQLDGYKFRRQQPIFDYVVDFYCHELKLIIEVDGEIHFRKEQINFDENRDKLLKINGYYIFRLTNFEIQTDLETSVNKLRSYISTNLSRSQGDHIRFSK
jgi:very-short-patch-repair endonuclease